MLCGLLRLDFFPFLRNIFLYENNTILCLFMFSLAQQRLGGAVQIETTRVLQLPESVGLHNH